MENKSNIYTKILAVQSEIGTLKKDKDNPYFKSKYLDINGIIEQLLPLLQKHKLCVTQPLSSLDGKPAIMTVVSDTESDAEVISKTPLPETAKAQDMGSAVTYLRRYSLQSFFLLQAEDDDGNSASGKQSPSTRLIHSARQAKAAEDTRTEAGSGDLG